MDHLRFWRLAAAACFIAVHCGLLQSSLHGQNRVDGRPRGDLRGQPGDERVNRQTEILRLQQMIDRLESRVQRLERQSVSATQLPMYSIAESLAAVRLAQLQLAATEQAFKNGDASPLQVAEHQMDVARFQTQLEIARAVHDDRTLALESGIAYAQRRVIEETQAQQQLQRMVAKGYTTAEGLELQTIDLEIARKELTRATARLELHSKLGSIGEPEKSQVKKDD